MAALEKPKYYKRISHPLPMCKAGTPVHDNGAAEIAETPKEISREHHMVIKESQYHREDTVC
jgi:hypothetical protein